MALSAVTPRDRLQRLVDLGRVTLLLKRARRKLTLRALDRISPLAVPVLLEIGRVSIADGAIDLMLEEGHITSIRELYLPPEPAKAKVPPTRARVPNRIRYGYVPTYPSRRRRRQESE